MRFIERIGSRNLRAAMWLVGLSFVSELSAQSPGNSSPPPASPPRQSSQDPFAATDRVPTPIVPYASSSTEPAATVAPVASAPGVSATGASATGVSTPAPIAVSPNGTTNSPPMTELAPLKPIEAGPLTSLSPTVPAPSATLLPPSDNRDSGTTGIGASESGKPTAKKSTPVVRERPRTPTKNVAKSKTLPTAEDSNRSSTGEGPAKKIDSTPESKSDSMRPVNFHFPQPPIPLESMLRRLFGYFSAEPNRQESRR